MADPLGEYPRQYARTRGFSLGAPRSFAISPDGARLAFLRTRFGDDPMTCLWALDVASGQERLVFDPRSVEMKEDERELSGAERARRERLRELAGGVTAYATDRQVRRAVFSVHGRMFLADLAAAGASELSASGPVDDPRLDPTGERVAYVVDGALHLREIEGGDRVLAADDEPDVSWGLPEFIAAEDIHRFRGHWWSPDGTRLAATRVDERMVPVWFIADLNDPSAPPRAVRRPPAGAVDASVTLWIFDVATGDRVEVPWDRAAFPYLARVHWSSGGPLTLLVQSRDQRTVQLLEADAATGAAVIVGETSDPQWVELAEDAPVRLTDGRVVTIVADREVDTYRLAVDGKPVTPPGLQVRGVLEAGDGVLVRGSEDPTEIHLWRWATDVGLERLTEEPGVHTGVSGGDVLLRVSSTLDAPLPVASVLRGGEVTGTVRSVAEEPVVLPAPRFVSLGEHELHTAVLLPNGREPDGPLPVLLNPYGGPHGAQVLRTLGAYLTSQWLADQGFAVLVVDGRGVDGRGPAWDREVFRDFAVALEDQVEALHVAADRFGFLDLSRVAIRGWSFGGYLAAMAVLRRPDVFHAAVAGAPVTDWRLYETYYTERFLGRPQQEPDVYDRNSLLADAPNLERPLLLVHGIADDNVFVAHTLKLSAAMFEAGRPHELVLIPGATHLTRAEAVTENLLRLELDFLRRALGLVGS